MSLNKKLLSLDISLKELKQTKDINNLETKIIQNLEILTDTINSFLQEWESMTPCNNTVECIDRFFQEGYLQATDKESIKKMINFIDTNDKTNIYSNLQDYINAVENIFQTIYFEYRFC
ncbi:MAG: hypothetical protein GXO22_00105 [Aquificae bacterium]|nr:hypothetical protein [Aquificota bacterium]